MVTYWIIKGFEIFFLQNFQHSSYYCHNRLSKTLKLLFLCAMAHIALMSLRRGIKLWLKLSHNDKQNDSFFRKRDSLSWSPRRKLIMRRSVCFYKVIASFWRKLVRILMSCCWSLACISLYHLCCYLCLWEQICESGFDVPWSVWSASCMQTQVYTFIQLFCFITH